MTAYDSIVVEGDFISEHYLGEEFGARVAALRKDWAEREKNEQTTPREGLTTLSTGFVAALTRYRENPNPERLAALYEDIREALQLERADSGHAAELFTSWRGHEQLSVQATIFRDSGKAHLLVLEAADAHSVEDVLDSEAAGHLVSPLMVGDTPELSTARALSTLFLADSEQDQPAFVLVLAGGWLLLAERERWPEGRWLAVDLATVAERKDTKAAGELETVAALISADALLLAADGTCLLQRSLEESVKHAVGVSQDLRDGVRRSIEIVATEVVDRRRAAALQVEEIPDLAYQLTRQSLRFLYRILFLLYAEARPELGVLPVDAPEYVDGYGLDRLRELVSVPLATDTARNGTHLYESLHRLFVLVDTGHTAGSSADDEGGLQFEALRADLFKPDATPLIDGVKLGNHALQRVLEQLLLSKERRGRGRGFVSYAQLGINQLGAVYEGLMSYSGFFADQPLYEVAKGGDPSKGTWVVPVAQAEQLLRELGKTGDDSTDGVFVREKDPDTDEQVRVRHETGSFVFRLSGRERQRSASYYTPEVLTRCVVTHSLAELLDQDGETTPAEAILNMTVCEPALGSGAFLIEAVNQLAEQYLKRRQGELDQRIPAEEYQHELQKVKAYLSLHQCYGVDLNDTAVEFAEISLWLNSMYQGLSAPWFGLHLRRGNSLIGCRRAVYKKSKLAKKAWLTTVPDDRPLAESVDVNEIHHFLLPSNGWGAVADTREAKELRPEAVAALKTWRSAVRKSPDRKQQDRLLRLSRRVEKLWQFARSRLRIAESEIRRDIKLWGAENLSISTDAVSREQIEGSLADENGAYRRLRRVMDAWCALWYWPVTTDVDPPNCNAWIAGLEALLGVADSSKSNGQGQLGEDDGWTELGEAEEHNLAFNGARPIEEVLKRNPWLQVCDEIAKKEGFFHWELDFSPVFEHGGFDLQVGNPPWVRPDWKDSVILAESDPWFALCRNPDADIFEERRRALVKDTRSIDYLDERSSLSGTLAHLGNPISRPVLEGLTPDLYRVFIDQCWRSMRRTGTAGLIHLDSHLTETRAAALRSECYRRLARIWRFTNQLKLFEEIGNTKPYCVSIYGPKSSVDFLHAAGLFHPDTIDGSLRHSGEGAEPGIKTDAGKWDVSPHANRIIRVNEDILTSWAQIMDGPGTPPIHARTLTVLNNSTQRVITKTLTLNRFSSSGYRLTPGWNETTDVRNGIIIKRSEVPHDAFEMIYQNSNFFVSNPLAKSANSTMKSHRDFTAIDLENISEDFLPRTNIQPAVDRDEYVDSYPTWDGVSAMNYWRVIFRRRIDCGGERALQAALLPPGPAHIHLASTLHLDHAALVMTAGLWSSIPLDFIVKVFNKEDLTKEVIGMLPHVREHDLEAELALRTLRLNALTRPYSQLWSESYKSSWRRDSWTHDYRDRPALGDVTPEWRWETPLRTDFDRRQALVEIDAITAIMLDITAEELCTVYRTQFGVLRKYEKAMRFDANGRQVPNEALKEYEKKGDRADLGRYVLPFTPVDREKDMTRAHEVFTQRMKARQA